MKRTPYKDVEKSKVPPPTKGDVPHGDQAQDEDYADAGGASGSASTTTTPLPSMGVEYQNLIIIITDLTRATKDFMVASRNYHDTMNDDTTELYYRSFRATCYSLFNLYEKSKNEVPISKGASHYKEH